MSAQEELVSKINALLIKKYGNSSEGSQQRLFNEHDKDSDGLIDSKELSALLIEAKIGNSITRGSWVRGIIRHMDTDQDGQISWPEYRHAINSPT